MATEPERPTEKLLRGYAKKRREDAGAPIELHPAGRRILQGEVARRFNAPKDRAWKWQFRFPLRPTLGWGFAVLILFLGSVWLFVPASNRSKSREMLVRNELAGEPQNRIGVSDDSIDAKQLRERPMTLTPAMRVPPPTSAPAGQRIDNLQASDHARPEAGLAEPSRPPIASTGVLGLPSNSSAGNAGLAEARSSSATFAASTTPALQKDGFGLTADGIGGSNARFIQNFTQEQTAENTKFALADKLPRTLPVLVSFRVEQNGPDIRVVDSDGSVYAGSMQTTWSRLPVVVTDFPDLDVPKALALSEAQKQNGESKRERFEPQSGGYQNHFFVVSGTNLSLNTDVVFIGHLISLTDLTSATQKLPLSSGGAQVFYSSSNALPTGAVPLFNSGITGTVRIGTGEKKQIQAFPSKEK